MYAVFARVRIDPGRYDEALKSLHENIVPQVKGAPGFVRGTWFGDTEAGHGLTVFESEEQAQRVAGMITSAPDDPAQVEDVKVYEVKAEA